MDTWIRLHTSEWPADVGDLADVAGVFSARRPKPDRTNAVEVALGPGDDAFPADSRVVRPGLAAVSFIGFLFRKPGLTLDQFQTHWKGEHTQMGLRIPKVVRYVQHHLTEGAPVDGVVELGFDNEEDLLVGLNSDLMTGEIRQDEERFIDRSRAWGFVAQRNATPGTLS